MAHARKQIRDAVVATITGLPTTGSRVFASRVYPLAAGTDLPGLLVYTVDEASEVNGMSRPRTLHRVLTLRVDAVARAASSLDDTLDTICAEVEAALSNTKPAGVMDLFLASTEIELTRAGDQPYGIAHMQFQIAFNTKENAPETVA